MMNPFLSLALSNFNAQQLAIAAGLCEWRDVVARTEDESTGYILPNKTLLEIAKQMPTTVGKLRRQVKSKHPYVERNIAAVLSVIMHAIQNASAFEAVAEQLKQGALNVVRLLLIEDKQGARFAKWRTVVSIPCGPSALAVKEAAWGLARYAAISQDNGLVPIVEPEILLDGDHSIERTREVAEQVWAEVFYDLAQNNVLFEGILLKPSMVTPGYSGSGFQSKNEYLFGRIDMQMKLVAGNSAGTVTAYYLLF